MSRYCSQCGKAIKACICQWIQSLTSNVELIILQHPTEQKRPLGTARILNLSLANSYCFIGENFTDDSALNELLQEEDTRHYVLFPSEESLNAQMIAQNLDVRKSKVRVILIDGTWKKAYKIWQLSNNLHSLPRLALPEELQGNYKIRQAPSDNSLSTVEAGFHILSLLEPNKDFSPLTTAFEKMIEFQIAQMPPGVYEKNYLKPKG
ncbi:tRNA-uridine aminocarboxypropyltransferase [Vibrio sonorensis]|uniref:tRNA-uridine aminocarboxypropyltransferase n=1 Tax=Vibrio sonorensis TaxID=1004316 RepID=UPI0008DAE938|nr:DTW domain-containing protein [Vibrio sonorensis]